MSRSTVNAVIVSELVALVAFVPMLIAMAIWTPRLPTVWYSNKPAGPTWVDVVLVVFIADFLLSKSWLMAARTWSWQRLGVSLIAANLAFGIFYLVTVATAFWPIIGGEPWVRLTLRVMLVCAVGWGKVELIRTWNQDETDDGYAEVVRENELLRDTIERHGIAVPVPGVPWDGSERRTGPPDRRQVRS